MADMRKQLSYTAAEIDERLGAVPDKVDKVTGKGLSTNDYTDTDKTAVGTIGDKVDKVTGKGLSTNDFTDADKAQISTNKSDIQGLEGSKIDVTLKTIPSGTTIQAFADTLSLGTHHCFYNSANNASDAPVNVHAIVEIHKYSATTGDMTFNPLSTTYLLNVYRKIHSSGVWRDWVVFTGTAVS